MEVIIHRGTHQIGGCATEYRTKNTRIFIDFGAELLTESPKPLDIEGVTKGQSDCDAVFFTHYHGDHIGLLDTINPDIPLYMGEAAKAITQILNDRLKQSTNMKSYDAKRLDQIMTFKAVCPLQVGDIRITPLAADHSAYDAYMFLIEADGKRILHTGDFRAHGLRGRRMLPTLKKHVGRADALVCEGTTLSKTASKAKTEEKLKSRIKKVLNKNKYVFVVCSSTNIDRLAGICSAVPIGRYCICDRYQLSVIDYIRQTAEKDLQRRFKKALYYDENLDQKMLRRGFCMFVRLGNTEHRSIMEKYRHLNPLVIYSMWKGYLDKPDAREFLDGYRWVQMHTSGHADRTAIKAVIDAVSPDIIIPIHTEVPEAFLSLAGKDRVVSVNDGNKIVIGG